MEGRAGVYVGSAYHVGGVRLEAVSRMPFKRVGVLAGELVQGCVLCIF